MRVFELAKELCISSKEMLEKCRSLGFNVKGHMSSFDEHQVRIVRAMFPPPTPEQLAKRDEQIRLKEQRKRELAEKRRAKKEAEEEKKRKEEEERKREEAAKAVATPQEGVAAAVETETAEAVEEIAAPAGAEKAVEVEEEEPATVGQEIKAVETAPEKEEAKEKAPAGKASVVPGQLIRAAEAPEEALLRRGSRRMRRASVEIQHVGTIESLPETEDAVGKEEEKRERAAALAGRREDTGHKDSLVDDRKWEKLTTTDRELWTRRGRIGDSRRERLASRSQRRRSRISRRRPKSARAQRPQPIQPPGEVEIAPPFTIRLLSEKMGVPAGELMSKLITHELFLSVNDVVPVEPAVLVAMDFGVDLKIREVATAESHIELIEAAEDKPEDLRPKSPVVTFLGHVDHGKTSLLDKIRQTSIAEGEAGHITQHIGASRVRHGDGWITFLDTPGHEAFTDMRARGANVTDIVVLVVAADDGVMPQTEEAVSHAKAAGVPIIVAMNKVDLPGLDTRRVRQQLSSLDVSPEEWGGEAGVVETSAITGQGVSELMDRILLEAEMLNLAANPDKLAKGIVLEAKLSQGRGVVATMLVQDGTLKTGDVIVCSNSYGRVRMLYDDKGNGLDAAGPSVPASIIGLDEVPEAGDKFYALESLEKARQIAIDRAAAGRRLAVPAHVTFESLHERLAESGIAQLRIIFKADVKGSVEAIVSQFENISTESARISVLHAGVGAVSYSDVLLADASDAVVVGFGVSVDMRAREEAEQKGIEIRLYSVIYDLLREVHDALEGKLTPEEKEVVVGHAEVRQLFKISRLGTVAGCYVTDGVIERRNRIRVIKNGDVAYTGTIASLRRLKEDAREVRAGFECGIKVEGFNDVKEGDVLEAFVVEKVARTLA